MAIQQTRGQHRLYETPSLKKKTQYLALLVICLLVTVGEWGNASASLTVNRDVRRTL